jgi:ATP-dependent Lon protease
MIVPLFVGRDKSVAALESAMAADKSIFLVSQLDPAEDDPDREALYDLGVVATVLQLLKLPDGTVRVLVEGRQRAMLKTLRQEGTHLAAEVELIESGGPRRRSQALMRSVIEQFENYSKVNRKLPAETAVQLGQIEEPSKLADAVAANVNIKVSDKQALLAELDPVRRLEMAFAFMEGELGVLQVEKKIRSRVKRQMEKTQREYYLNEQLKAIQRELGNAGEEGEGDELAELAKKIERTKLSKEARSKAQSELKKLKAMAPMSAEATVSRNYLDVLLGLPWGKKSKLKHDITEAERILDEDHYGLEKVKERIVEYLAVQVRTNKLKGPILCLVGPPGVGKTSLGRSIARATGREFVRQSLGGVRDEAEIRGHRRTYIGSLPGKIVTNLKKAGTSNPLFLLDEIDKLGQDFRGDPASALLEVLDPEQNSRFQDHYLEVDYDLSDVMFVTTANSMDMPQPLLDRMEIIRLEGYTEDEKVEIAKRHLIPKQIESHGLKDGELTFTDEGLRGLIRYHTREAGVRTLEREIAKVSRKALRQILEGRSRRSTSPRQSGEFVGVRRFRHGMSEEED